MLRTETAGIIGPNPDRGFFAPAVISPELAEASRGDLRWLSEGERYALSGGSTVEVFKIPGAPIYGAVVDLRGGYPEEGREVRNDKRVEKIFLVSGSAEITINGAAYPLSAGQAAVVVDGDRYRLRGEAQLFVLVADEPGGCTRLADPEGAASLPPAPAG